MADLENVIIRISVGEGTSLGRVKTKQKTWKTFRRMFARELVLVDTSCTYAQYKKLDVDAQGKKKLAAGNWMPALFKDGKRKGPNQLCRTMVAFDLDYVSIEQLDHIRDGGAPINQYAWFMHTTRSHCPEKPRVRMIVPLSREVTLDEANALTRILATYLADDPEEGIEIPDIVSMKANQVMYLPSISRDQEYWTDENEGELLDVDEFLAEHPLWDDHALLPHKESETNRGKIDPSKRMEDPREKQGYIGAFCRTYDIEDAIAEFIPDVYAQGDSTTETRYTYLLGTGSNGAVVYDEGLFIYSNHGSDPIEGAANAWDMVRIHKFGHLDKDAPSNTALSNLPSSKAMMELAKADEAVRREMVETLVPNDDWDDDDQDDDDDDAGDDGPSIDDLLGGGDDEDDGPSIDDLLGGGADEDEDEDEDDPFDGLLGGADEDEKPEKKKKKKDKAETDEEPKWQSSLVVDKQNNLEKSLHNCATIVKNSARVAPCIALNDLDGGPYLRKLLRFPKANLAQARVDDPVAGRRWTDTDTAALMCALAAPQKMGGYATQFTRQDVELSLLQAAEKNRYNPFLDKITAVEWDGIPRLATFFHDWFYTEDNAYHAELATVWFVAGVARQYEPGHRFDLVPILGGKQGGGKSGAIDALGMGYGGSLSGDFHDTQKMTESTKGKTVLEVPELKGLSKSEVEDVKHYFTATKDTVRLAYRRNEEDFFRRCVYMGTTNQSHYLRDEENRRFCPVLTGTSRFRLVDFARFVPAIPQFWAEAHHLYLEMRKAKPYGLLPLHFTSKEAKDEALRLQTEARDTMPYEPVQEVIERWLNTPLTKSQAEAAGNGGSADLEFDDEDEGGEVYVRNLVTVTMIREELERNPIIRELRGGYAEKTIAQALKNLPGWLSLGAVHRLGRKARWYARENSDTYDEFVAIARRDETSIEDLLG
ncbi:DNA helicase [Ruegeria phage DSS3-P1]|uniref:DNA helicase n=1 Tax=Ruegeria phage DSS3-P1 TaxID=1555208 RepID=UPI0002357D39|nr:DNA helicase [Ruegeria phage DSS3-P1]YP_009997298.1 DNA helicase [Ruegeria phage vB_RpoS-V18]YP_009997380.1 DNA helicase [Ruegeria phage vB_RpoS-V11]YP_009997464.1 DNA helicase [Ruegeria phage vB_RpoS-V7]AET42291.1 hypothetical protein SDSG_00025 [Ruegeria phage DSS3-P1]AIT13316.1 virulence-associated protein [Ruegeria phage DSS3-P1]AWY08786.1 virulence-associated protein [Ruegeria phage vB_RpoS-V7]AWY08957.1 virulence-associated protein [Ruegeria phage vB_RpoS-V18]AWY09121.1 virulence-a